MDELFLLINFSGQIFKIHPSLALTFLGGSNNFKEQNNFIVY